MLVASGTDVTPCSLHVWWFCLKQEFGEHKDRKKIGREIHTDFRENLFVSSNVIEEDTHTHTHTRTHTHTHTQR
jgi:hypothetical protein